MLLIDVDLDKVGNLRIGSYSGGMKRRISLAIALIGDPELLILDEPVFLSLSLYLVVYMHMYIYIDIWYKISLTFLSDNRNGSNYSKASLESY